MFDDVLLSFLYYYKNFNYIKKFKGVYMISYCNPKGSQLVRYWIYSSMVSQVGLNTQMMIEAKALDSPSHMLNASIKSIQKIDVGLFVMVKEESSQQLFAHAWQIAHRHYGQGKHSQHPSLLEYILNLISIKSYL